MLQETAQASKHSGQRYSIGSNHHLDRLKRVDREALKHMTSYERRIWVRSQITNFKADYITQRGHSSQSFPMVDSSTQVYLPPINMPRRHSLEGLGSHFEQFLPGSLFSRPDSFTISATRTSEADTAVEIEPLSSRASSTLDPALVPRHRSWSPHPSSLPNPQFPWRHLNRELGTRNSMDSVLSGGVPSGWTGRRGADRGSIGSLTHMTLSSSRLPTVQGGSARASQEMSAASGTESNLA